MISLLGLGYNGRLGNQMFLYAAGRALSIKLNTYLGLVDYNQHICHEQPCLLDSFNLKFERINNYGSIRYSIVDPPCNFTYLNSFSNAPDNTILNGHFVHEDYFFDYKDKILEDFTLKDTNITSTVIDKLNKFKYPIAVHFRLGDQQKETKDIVYEYTRESLKLFPKQSDFIIIGGGNRSNKNTLDQEELSNIEKVMSGYSFTYMYSEDTITDLEVMKHCKGNIVSPFSTYSWWAAYRNTSAELVVYPKVAHIKAARTWVLV